MKCICGSEMKYKKTMIKGDYMGIKFNTFEHKHTCLNCGYKIRKSYGKE